MSELGNSPTLASGLVEALNAVGAAPDRQEKFQLALDVGGGSLTAVVESLVGPNEGLNHVEHFVAARPASVPLMFGAAQSVAAVGVEFKLDIANDVNAPDATVTLAGGRVVAEVRALSVSEEP